MTRLKILLGFVALLVAVAAVWSWSILAKDGYLTSHETEKEETARSGSIPNQMAECTCALKVVTDAAGTLTATGESECTIPADFVTLRPDGFTCQCAGFSELQCDTDGQKVTSTISSIKAGAILHAASSVPKLHSHVDSKGYTYESRVERHLDDKLTSGTVRIHTRLRHPDAVSAPLGTIVL